MIWNQIAKRLYSSNSMILTLHRVMQKSTHGLGPNETMTVSPEYLERLILNLKSKGFTFHSLNELENIFSDGEIGRDRRVFITLDDGYVDNYSVAWPLFKKLQIPFTLFLTTAFPNGAAKLWWYAIEEVIMREKSFELGGVTYNAKLLKDKLNCFWNIRTRILTSSVQIQESLFAELAERYGIDWKELCARNAMTWAHLKEMSLDPLFDLGCHTVDHYPLERLSVIEIEKQVIKSTQEIESVVGAEVSNFAYPYGSSVEADVKTIQAVKELNFKTAVTTRSGFLTREHANFTYALPRIMLLENDTIDSISYRSIRSSRFQKVVTF